MLITKCTHQLQSRRHSKTSYNHRHWKSSRIQNELLLYFTLQNLDKHLQWAAAYVSTPTECEWRIPLCTSCSSMYWVLGKLMGKMSLLAASRPLLLYCSKATS